MKKELFLIFCLQSITVMAEENVSILLDPIKIKEQIEYIDIANENGFVKDIVSKDSIESLLGAAQTGSYKSFDMLPSVNQQSNDAYGLALGKTMRIRGSYSGDDFIRNIEGLPVSSHGGGGDFIDFENVASVQAYRGAIETGSNLGIRNLTGGMNLNILWPKKELGGQIRQALGSNNMQRTFVRFDSGNTPTNTRLFFSYSTSKADKWRGEGEAPGKRENFEIGIAQKITDNLDVKVFAVHHELKQHDYRALSYAQIQDLSKNYDVDYNKNLLGDSTQDGLYYDYTRQSYKDTMVLSDITYTFDSSSSIKIKPYYWKDTGYRYIGRGNSVTYLTISPIQYGLSLDYNKKFNNGTALKVGYWYQGLDDSLPPPLAMRSYSLDSEGLLSFSKWTMLGKIGSKTYQAPYVDFMYTGENWKLKAGLRYLIQQDPTATFYNTDGIPDVSYDSAFAYSSGVNHSMDIPSRKWEHLLPGLGGEYYLQNGITLFASYARGYGYTAWPGQIMSYSFKKAKLDAAGISFENLWKELKPEEMDNFDIGFSHNGSILKSRANFYYSIHKNKTVTVYDELADVSYLKSDADATSYGAEVTFSADLLNKSLNLYTALSYNIHQFNNDVTTALDNTVSSKGKQVPDTPKEMVKIGAHYHIGDFSIHPLIKYIGKRYGDIENTQSVDSYTTIDLQAVYDIPKFSFVKDARFSISCYNLTNEEYVGKIDTSDFQLNGASGYYPGAPFTVAAALDVKF